jgi:ankyrin repeat protein
MVNKKNIKLNNNLEQTNKNGFEEGKLLKETKKIIKKNNWKLKNPDNTVPLLHTLSDGRLNNIKYIVNNKILPYTQEDLYKCFVDSLNSKINYYEDSIETAKFLLSHISDNALMNKIISQSDYVYNLDYITFSKKDINLFKQLIEMGVEINESDEDGNTPLHLASEKGMEELVKFLIKNKANLHVENNMNKTPYALALEQSHDSIIEIYIEYFNKNNQEELASELKEMLDEGTLLEHSI